MDCGFAVNFTLSKGDHLREFSSLARKWSPFLRFWCSQFIENDSRAHLLKPLVGMDTWLYTKKRALSSEEVFVPFLIGRDL